MTPVPSWSEQGPASFTKPGRADQGHATWELAAWRRNPPSGMSQGGLVCRPRGQVRNATRSLARDFSYMSRRLVGVSSPCLWTPCMAGLRGLACEDGEGSRGPGSRLLIL